MHKGPMFSSQPQVNSLIHTSIYLRNHVLPPETTHSLMDYSNIIISQEFFRLPCTWSLFKSRTSQCQNHSVPTHHLSSKINYMSYIMLFTHTSLGEFKKRNYSTTKMLNYFSIL